MTLQHSLCSVAVTLVCAPFAIAQIHSFVTTAPETIWNTDSTLVVPTMGVPYIVTGGVFVFNNVTISAGTTLRITGSRPMLLLCNRIDVHGTIDGSGGFGHRVQTIGAANVPASGGLGGPAGGRGGAGSPQIGIQSLQGQSGNGPGDSPGLGGGGGLLSFLASCGRASGGGGGAFATAGDPHYKQPQGAGTSFIQRAGVGGFGCLGMSGAASRTLQGGGPGGVMFVDGQPDNDFFGLGYNVFTNQLVVGELQQLIGGAGGGGGGNLSNDNTLLSPNWINDPRGGGGGGGGGCLLIASQTDITVWSTGTILANGGHGGGGEMQASNNRGGGGGGGSGGLLILAAQGQINLHVRGGTYANNDYNFVLSADGGVSTTLAFPTPGSPIVFAKYPQSGQQPMPGPAYDSAPLGGFGGMGIVQLVTRPGTNADGTNTVLDDNISLFLNGLPLSGAQKIQYLAWRGFSNALGVLVDDFGVPTNIGANEGDIRPAPVLLPIF